MADNGGGSTAIVAIFVILIIAVGAYFLLFANPGVGGGDGGNTIQIIVPTSAP